ncbi:outer membrane lipoprotein-sorting protein [Nitrosovibrio sp. Nv17]|nr:outer membrane lipoprotein-sorting protein [Nitrosovibrio sp. Nv17]
MNQSFLYRLMVACLFLASVPSTVARAEEAISAQGILENADQIRFPRESFQVDVNVTSTAPDQAADIRKYRVLSKGNENSVVMTVEPASDRGQAILMKGRDLWIFLPDVSQPVRLSLSQRLTGQVANGDLARANFTGDYNATILRTDTIDDEKFYVLELTGVDRGVTYHKVLYWIRQTNHWPYRAEFYSLSDRLLKTAYYEDFKLLLGKHRPTRLVMEDALRKGEKSVLEYSEMKLQDLPDKIFTKNYLKKLE